MADEDYTQIDPEIQNLVKKLDKCIAKIDQKRQVLENAIESEIEALKKDQNETRKLRLNLLDESGATSSNIEAGSRKVANVKQWLNQKALISGDTSGDHDQGYVCLLLNNDCLPRIILKIIIFSVFSMFPAIFTLCLLFMMIVMLETPFGDT